MDDDERSGLEDLPLKMQSYWMATAPGLNNKVEGQEGHEGTRDYPEFEAGSDMSADVAIIGGGLVGITLGYLLKKEGLRVVIIEAGKLATGVTGHTTAKITSQHSLIYDQIKKQQGEELSMQYAQANEFAIGAIEKIALENNIECDYIHQPAYVYTLLDEYIAKLADETAAASSFGIKACLTDDTPLPFKVKAAMRFDGQAMFHPRKYLLPLAATIPGDGSAIFENTRAVDLHEGSTCSVILENGGKISAPIVVLATHYPFYDRHGMYFGRLYPVRSYVLGLYIREDFPDGMYINAESPSRSLRWQPDEGRKLVLAGGEHHKQGHESDTWKRYENLLDFAREVFTVESVCYRWSAHDYKSMDDLPYAGYLTKEKQNIFVATGYRKWGMTNSTASAFIIKDLILRRENPWAQVYSPSRSTAGSSVKNIIIENADTAANFIAGHLSGHPNCSHLGCALKWNDAERSWDCPCHGSRFSEDGSILSGPAVKPIKTDSEDIPAE